MNDYVAIICLMHCFIPNTLFFLKEKENSLQFWQVLHTLKICFDFSASLFVTPSCSKVKFRNAKGDTYFYIQHYRGVVKTITKSAISSENGLPCICFDFF